MQTRMPPHIEVMIRKNPNAVLTPRGVVAKRTERIDELLMGLPNADKMYSDHFDEIRAEQSENRKLATQATTETIEVAAKDDANVSIDAPKAELADAGTKDDVPESKPVLDVDKVAEEVAETATKLNDALTPSEKAFEGSSEGDDRTPQEVSDQIVEQNGYTDPFDAAFAEAKLNPKYKDLSDEEIKKRVQMSIAAKERAAKKKAEVEAAKSSS